MTDQPGSTPPDPTQPPPPPPGAPYGQQPSYPPAGPPPGGFPPAPPSYGQMPAGAAGGTPPPNYLVWAILTTLFCCLPFGIASIVFAAQVNSKWAAGDAAGAQESSRKAKQFATWAAIAGVIVIVLYVIFGVIVAGSNN